MTENTCHKSNRTEVRMCAGKQLRRNEKESSRTICTCLGRKYRACPSRSGLQSSTCRDPWRVKSRQASVGLSSGITFRRIVPITKCYSSNGVVRSAVAAAEDGNYDS